MSNAISVSTKSARHWMCSPACPSHGDGDSDRTLGTFHNRGGTVSSTFETTSCQGVALPSSCPADLTPSFRRALRAFSLFLEVCALRLRSPLGYATQIALAVTVHCPAAMRNQWAGLLSSSRHGRPGRREGRNQNCRPAWGYKQLFGLRFDGSRTSRSFKRPSGQVAAALAAVLPLSLSHLISSFAPCTVANSRRQWPIPSGRAPAQQSTATPTPTAYIAILRLFNLRVRLLSPVSMAQRRIPSKVTSRTPSSTPCRSNSAPRNGCGTF